MRPSRRLPHHVIIAAVAATLGACSPLGALNGVNNLTPGDGGTAREATAIAYGTADRQKLDVYTPAKAANAPVVVFFYGGNWQSGRRQDYAFAARALAAQGFVVVVPDYRLVPQVRFPAFVEDGAAAVAWTRANIGTYGGNAAAIGVAGHSAGAYIAAMVTLDPRWLAAAGAPGAVKAAVGLAGPYDFFPFEAGGVAEAALGGQADPKLTQPINFARSDAPPMLLLNGAEDSTVYPLNAERLAAALTSAGATADKRIYPDIGHIGILLAISKTFRGKAPALADTSAFLHLHLDAPATPKASPAGN